MRNQPKMNNNRMSRWAVAFQVMGVLVHLILPAVVTSFSSITTSRTTFLKHGALRRRRLFLSSPEHNDDVDDDNNEDASSSPHIVVLGGGFGGLNTALSLAGLSWEKTPTIQLIDTKERFVFLPLLYELCVGDADLEEVAPTYARLFKDNSDDEDEIRFTLGELQGIDVTQNVIYYHPDNDVRTTERVRYDALVVATGMQCQVPKSLCSNSDLVLPFYTVEHCYELRKRLTLLDASSLETVRAVIVGGGYSGVELALNLKERLGKGVASQIILVHRGSTILEGASDFNRNASLQRLKEAGIEILTNTAVDKVEPVHNNNDDATPYDCLIHTSDDVEFFANIVLWTAGGADNSSASGPLNSILPRDTRRRIVTDDTLLVRNTTNVWCVGDVARGQQIPLPANAQVAIQQAPVVAHNVRRELSADATTAGKSLSFRYLDLGAMMTLGSDDATMTSLGGLVTLDGLPASLARRLVYAVRMPTPTQAVRAALSSTTKRVRKTSETISSKKKREKVMKGKK